MTCWGIAAAVMFLPGLVACSGSHSLSHQELLTKSRALNSVSAEAETFVRHLDGHPYSSHVVDGHLTYLRTQGLKIQNELTGAIVDDKDARLLVELRETTGEIVRTLEKLESEVSNEAARSKSVNDLHSIRNRLEGNMPR